MNPAEQIVQDSVEVFLERLASADATPGGGSAAAVMGAMGAALAAMVCRLTVGKADYQAVQAEMQQALIEADALRQRLAAMVAEDVAAFDALMGAYRLPKAGDAEKAARSAAIQAGLQGATEAPLQCARACADVVRLCARVAQHGNLNVISDAGVGVLAAAAALRSAALNVYINAPSIKDRAFAEARLAEVEALQAEVLPLAERVFGLVRGKLG
jgi:formiminotetrahydrofolate cyclodeaminase